MAKCTFRNDLRRDGPGLQAWYSQSPRNLMPVLPSARQRITKWHSKRGHQVQRLARCAIRDLHRKPRVPAAWPRMVRNRPIGPGHLHHAFDRSNCLAARKIEGHFRRQAGLDQGIRTGFEPSSLADFAGAPDHLGIEPERKRAAPAQRRNCRRTISSRDSGLGKALACSRANRQDRLGGSPSPRCDSTIRLRVRTAAMQ